MSSVFISNVDDYLAPSQACVNPIFADGVNQKKDEKKEEPIAQNDVAVVVPRKRRVARKRRVPETASYDERVTPTSIPAKLTMADCLACSGCVTTAETVLVEQHSLATLKEALQTNDRSVVFTISPASWADLLRKLQLPPSLDVERSFTTFLHQSCRAAVVLDGRVPLQWSLQEAAREFCHAYRRRHLQKSSIPQPSIALSSSSFQCADGTIIKSEERHESRIPLLASSCPALVCLAEKSAPAAVPHLSTTESPMAMAGSYLKGSYHVAIMPCHDKKLEASRKDLHFDDEAAVDLVITTQELWSLLCETVNSEKAADVSSYVESLPMATISTSIKRTVGINAGPTLVIPASDEQQDVQMTDASSQDFYAYGSGGYADFIFRFACRELFGHAVQGDVPWTAVETPQTRRIASARVAASAKRRRDFFQVILYRHVDGSYSCGQQSPQDEPTLRFATAYGLQNIQRVLQHAPFSPTSNLPLPFDYVETMACPSGCPNGGGQIREGNVRETPTETRERVSETQELMKTKMRDLDSSLDYPSDLCPTGPFGPEAKRLLHTRYHVVPPLQHTMGAAAGVAVQDTQW